MTYDTILYFSGRLDFITFGFFESHKAPCSRNNNADKLLFMRYYHTTVLLWLMITNLLQFSNWKKIWLREMVFCNNRPWFFWEVTLINLVILLNLELQQFCEIKTAAALGAGVSSRNREHSLMKTRNVKCQKLFTGDILQIWWQHAPLSFAALHGRYHKNE